MAAGHQRDCAGDPLEQEGYEITLGTVNYELEAELERRGKERAAGNSRAYRAPPEGHGRCARAKARLGMRLYCARADV